MDKKIVNIYIASSVKGPRRQDGSYIYILETPTAAGPATYQNQGKLEDTTMHQIQLHALEEALTHIRQQCYMTIYTDDAYIVGAMTNGWAKDWERNAWCNKKGEPVADAEKWQQILSLLNGNEVLYALCHGHSYKDWMQRELKKMADTSL